MEAQQAIDGAFVSIGFVTDVEGDLDFFRRYCDISKVVCLDNDKLDFREESSYFVFGGDVFDRGPGDLRLSALLVDFKRRYSERVFLIIGNRDALKMRLAAELDEAEVRRSPEAAFAPFWLPAAKRTTYPTFLASSGEEDTRLARLRYALDTLGCAGTFEHRRTELAELRLMPPGSAGARAEVTDEDVLDSFLHSVTPEGAVAQYLLHAQIAALLGNTLFVHGAMDRRAMGFVPRCGVARYGPENDPQAGTEGVTPISTWVEAINAWSKEEVRCWLASPCFNEHTRRRGGEGLMAYFSFFASQGRTVGMTSYCVGGNMPDVELCGATVTKGSGQQVDVTNPADPNVTEDALRSGVHRVVVGHKPSGDSPAIYRSKRYGEQPQGLEVISADTSYADDEAADKRGRAVCEVLVEGPALTQNRTRVHGVLKDGTSYDFCLPSLGCACEVPELEGDAWVGAQTPDAWWVKTSLGAGEYFLSKGSGRRVAYERRHLGAFPGA